VIASEKVARVSRLPHRMIRPMFKCGLEQTGRFVFDLNMPEENPM